VNTGWKTVKLGEIVAPVQREEKVDAAQEYRLLGVRLDGKGAFLREKITGTQTAAAKLYRVAKDDFIYSRLFACRGAFATITDELDNCYVSSEFPTFVPIQDRIDVNFLKYWFRLPAVIASVDADCAGSTPLTRNRYKEKFFLALKIPLPSLSEQRCIVARIEELSAQINEARVLRQQATKEAETIYMRKLDLTMAPHGEGWSRKTVVDVICSMDAGWSPQCDDSPAKEGMWGVLKTTAVQWCDFQPQYNKVLPSTLEPRPELGIKEGDVLVTRAGPRKRVGVVAAVRQNNPRLTISDKLIRLRTDHSVVIPRFLELSLSSSFSQEHIVQRKTGLADAQVNISQAILKSTPIVFPPLPEQRRIVSELDALQTEVDALKRLQAETAAELDALLPAVLDRAFKGEL